MSGSQPAARAVNRAPYTIPRRNGDQFSIQWYRNGQIVVAITRAVGAASPGDFDTYLLAPSIDALCLRKLGGLFLLWVGNAAITLFDRNEADRLAVALGVFIEWPAGVRHG